MIIIIHVIYIEIGKYCIDHIKPIFLVLSKVCIYIVNYMNIFLITLIKHKIMSKVVYYN